MGLSGNSRSPCPLQGVVATSSPGISPDRPRRSRTPRCVAREQVSDQLRSNRPRRSRGVDRADPDSCVPRTAAAPVRTRLMRFARRLRATPSATRPPASSRCTRGGCCTPTNRRRRASPPVRLDPATRAPGDRSARRSPAGTVLQCGPRPCLWQNPCTARAPRANVTATLRAPGLGRVRRPETSQLSCLSRRPARLSSPSRCEGSRSITPRVREPNPVGQHLRRPWRAAPGRTAELTARKTEHGDALVGILCAPTNPRRRASASPRSPSAG